MEQNPDEKYFLKQETFEYLKSHSEECKRKGYGFRFSPVTRDECEIAKTITTEIGKIRMDDNFIQESDRVRKLTPKECFRLMGFTDDDFHKAHLVCSDTQLYKQAGNSIVVNVLEEILKKLVRIN